jgi:hypothetical protein
MAFTQSRYMQATKGSCRRGRKESFSRYSQPAITAAIGHIKMYPSLPQITSPDYPQITSPDYPQIPTRQQD